jgi:hypothetical protein
MIPDFTRSDTLIPVPSIEVALPGSMPPLLWGQTSLGAAAGPRAWLWQGYLAPGAVTLLTGQWKTGKTPLASVAFGQRLHEHTRKEILDLWPGDERPDKVTLGRWLERAVKLGLVRKSGRGTRNGPYEYWMPEREHCWS